MDRRDQLEQQIWELVYGLLPEDEAAALRRRIAAEPDVTRRYDEVRRQAALLAEAARLELPPIPLQPPGAEDAAPAAGDAPTPASTVAKPAPGPARRWVNWAVGLAASALACYLGVAGYQTGWLGRTVAGRSPEATLVDQPVRAVLIGPQEFQPVLTNYVAVQTRNAAGAPVAAKVDYRWYGDGGTPVASGQCQTDASGFTQLALASPLRTQAVHLEVAPQTPLKNVSLRCSIPVAISQLTTYVTTDKTIYRPGERVRYRTVTLDRADLQVHREVPVAFRVVNEEGEELNGLGGEVVTKKGVGSGEFELPRFQPSGKRTLIAASPTGDFPEARREFEVRPYRTPALRQTLDFARDSYGPGDEVEADLRVELADGKPARNVPLAVRAESGGQKFFNLHTMTDDQGSYRVRFNLPAQVEPGQTVLNVTTGKEVQEQISELIPVHQGRVTVEFFPESGDLVPNVLNRVYFFARDALDRPVHIRGRVVDGPGRQVAQVQTTRDGRGVFALRPARDQRYRLLIDQPSDIADQLDLPQASSRQFVAINAGPGVFPAGAPIRVKLVSQEDRPVAVVAVCRGVVVGQELVSPAEFRDESEAGGTEVVVPVAETAEGVIRLTAYDYSAQPPTPVAERLVYRRPARKLSIHGTPPKTYSPGDAVNLAFSVQDERGRPQSAVLGASVVDEAALRLVRDRSASLTTHFWLTGQIDDVRGLEDANFYLSEGAEAEQALDLLLGTQGWRRFVDVPAKQLALAPAAGQAGGGEFAYHVPASVVVSEPTAPTVLADNAHEASQVLRSGLASLRAAYEQTVRRVGSVLIVGSLILAIMLALLAVMRRLPATTVWLPALGTSAMCLVLGCVWLVTQGRPARELEQIAWDDSVAEQQVAQAGKPVAADLMPEASPTSELARVEGRELGVSRESADKAKGADRKKADQGAVVGDDLSRTDKAAAPADEADLSVPAEQAKKLQASERDQYGAQLEQRQSLAGDARSGTEAMKRRVAGERYEAPGQDAVRQSEGASESPGARRAPSLEQKPFRSAVAGQIEETPAMPQERLAELRSAPSAAAPATAAPVPAAAVPMAAPLAVEAAPAAEMPPASQPVAGAKAARLERATGDVLLEKAEKKASQLRFGKMAEEAEGLMPGMEAQSAPGAMSGMGGGVGALGGAVAPNSVRDRESRVQMQAAGKEKAAGPASAYGGAARPSAPSSRGKPDAERALKELADQPVPAPSAPAAPEMAEPISQPFADSPERSGRPLYRQYASRGLTAIRADELSPPAETVFWAPLLDADAQGQTTLQFKLPAAATTYRVLVDGHAAGRIGSYLGRIVVQPNAAAPK